MPPFPSILCALTWVISPFIPLPSHPSNMSGWDNMPQLSYAWPPPPWFAPGSHPPGMHPPGMHPPGMHPPGMLPPGQEAFYAGHQPLLDANGRGMSTPSHSHPPVPPHLRPTTIPSQAAHNPNPAQFSAMLPPLMMKIPSQPPLWPQSWQMQTLQQQLQARQCRGSKQGMA